ncbi:MAG TPA: hypothetical protein VN963_07230 [bacterium]|nr:hypothetical protein [bacterium]
MTVKITLPCPNPRPITSYIKTMRAFCLCAIFVMLLCLRGSLAQTEITAPTARLTPVPIQQVTVEDAFWSPKIKLWCQKVRTSHRQDICRKTVH